MKKPPYRVWIGVMLFMTTFTNYMLRANMSVSIIKMVGKSKNEAKHIPPCKKEEMTNTTTKPSSSKTGVKFDWNENQVGDILSGYFYGYLVALLPAGFLAEKLGPWHVILWSSVASAVLTGLTPLSANLGFAVVVVNRVLIGLLGGLVYPAVNVLIANWAPPNEKGKFVATMMGNTLGTVVTFNLVSVVTATWGWDWGFYVLVILEAAYCLIFFFVVSNTPSESRWTSQEERDYILEAQQGLRSKKKVVAPYLKMLKSVPFWVLCIAQFGSLWSLNLILTYAPKFMAETLGFNLKASAGLAALPYLARLISGFCFGTIGDIMRKRNIMSLTHIRKILAHFLPAICFCLVRAAGCSPIPVVILLVLNQTFNGGAVVSHLINPQDLAPNFTGSVFGLMNMFGMITGIVVPKISGALTDFYNKELEASTIIFTIGGGVSAFTGIIFIFFGTAEVQPWNEIKEKEEAATQE